MVCQGPSTCTRTFKHGDPGYEVGVATAHALGHKTRNAHAQKGKTDLNKTRIFKMATMEDMSKIRISSCFMHFEGVTEQLPKLLVKGLRNLSIAGINGRNLIACKLR